jgi:hypothetical protein
VLAVLAASAELLPELPQAARVAARAAAKTVVATVSSALRGLPRPLRLVFEMGMMSPFAGPRSGIN